MATKTVPSPSPKATQPEIAVNLLQEIVAAADATDRRCNFVSFPSVSSVTRLDLEEIELLVDQLRETMCRVGWIAESALLKIGASDVLRRGGSAVNWLLAPTCRETADQTEASHG